MRPRAFEAGQGALSGRGATAPPLRTVPGTRPPGSDTQVTAWTPKSWNTAGGLDPPVRAVCVRPRTNGDKPAVPVDPQRSKVHERLGLPVPPSAFGRVRVVVRWRWQLLPSPRTAPGAGPLGSDSPVTPRGLSPGELRGYSLLRSGRYAYAPGRTDTERFAPGPSFRSRANERVGHPVPPSASGRVRGVDR